MKAHGSLRPRPAESGSPVAAWAAAAIMAAATAISGCSDSTAPAGAPSNPAHAAPSPSSPASPAVAVAKPLTRRIADWDEYTGRLAAPETVEIRARVSGHLDRVHFREGSEVQAGDLLFTIDPRPYRAALDRATAEWDRARHRSQLAEAEATRACGLLASRAISTDNHDERVQAAGEARASVQSAQAGVDAAKLDLEFTEIRSPIRGRVSNARVTAGNLVSAGTTGSAILTTVVSVDPLWCYVDVDERSVLRYRRLGLGAGRGSDGTNAPVAVRVGLLGEGDFPRNGRLDFVDNQVNPATGTIRLRVVLPNPDGLAAPGFFARVRVPGTAEYEAAFISDAAVGNDQGRPFVWILNAEDVVQFRPLELGPLVEGLRAVRSGLTPNDRVVVSGIQSVRPGTKVQPRLVSMNDAAAPPSSSGGSMPANGPAGASTTNRPTTGRP